MTTEIAVINRLGVALAADSAVTISGFGESKVFNSGDKLFELSCDYPVAVMINGNLDFLSVPWELIIKSFRDESGSGQLPTMKDWADALIDWTMKHPANADHAAQQWLREFIKAEVNNVWSNLAISINEAIKDSRIVDGAFVDQCLSSELENEIARSEKEGPLSSLEGLSEGEVRNAIQPTADEILNDRFRSIDISAERKEQFFRLLSRRLLTRGPTDVATGIVVTGFAGADIFPSLHAIVIDGVLCGRPRFHVEHRIEIRRSMDGDADITRELGTAISFAQTDVIDRLLRGADSRFIRRTQQHFKESIETTINDLAQELKLKISTENGDDIQTELFATFLAHRIPDLYVSGAAKEISDEIELAFKQTIAVMPKQELIELAEALVSITAIERKASSDRETVGGPIDVALITKSEGFVWIKRKHYFDPGLNPRYFQRIDAVMKRKEQGHG